ncbi:MarR family transcriptional regulator [Paralcaligenes sp. KSB-10]|uniref:MarR family winged helix-turn-helix transcriptional regulator n=1 Tax=Paralcaligenes sp. KSB-10 TaxID=2901142 RepID=UPI001E454EB8|nr:MarR family transcriptional regulator [Paralcaligenes sp. KSB-10]UHL64967.1 MarR family transcriptional regulator [Paralcaligenes sp. KSB-10]
MNRSIFYEDCNCFALRQATRYITQIYERHLGQVGLTAAQFTILARLARTPGLTAMDLADAMVMERTTLVRALKPLQRDGLVVSEISKRDGRAHVFSLSKSGERVFDLAAVAWSNAQGEFESRVGPERARSLRAELFYMTTVQTA